jgi:hypothetical protein
LNEAETQTLILSETIELPPELNQKLNNFGLDDGFISIVGRNLNLVLKNMKGQEQA